MLRSFPPNKLAKTAEITPYSRNARGHSAAQIAQIVASIQEFGFTNPVLLDEHNVLIAGHGRLEAARYLGMPQLPAIVLAGLSDAQKQALRIADNKLALNATWDDDLLRTELMDLRDGGFDLALTGFGEDELLGLFADHNAGLTDPDDVPEAPAEPVTQPGDVWLLGKHRLVCGDCTDETVIASVMAGRAVDLLVTSPPYNQRLDKFKPSGMQRETGWVNRVSGAYADSMPEREYQEWQRALLQVWHSAMRDGASVFYNHKHRYRDKRVVSPLEWLPGPFVFRQEIIWSRPGSVTQNARMFLPSDERVYWLYKGDDFTFDDTTEIKSWSSVWQISPGSDFHAVGFPVELPRRCIRAASMPGDAVLDPFVGSGTTIIAAEMTGRACHAIEISPAYCDVAVQRWQNFTGQTATRPDGTPFQAAHRETVPAD
jgi:DNA modification methylase